MAEGDQEEETEGIFVHWYTIIIKTVKRKVYNISAILLYNIQNMPSLYIDTYLATYVQYDK